MLSFLWPKNHEQIGKGYGSRHKSHHQYMAEERKITLTCSFQIASKQEWAVAEALLTPQSGCSKAWTRRSLNSREPMQLILPRYLWDRPSTKSNTRSSQGYSTQSYSAVNALGLHDSAECRKYNEIENRYFGASFGRRHDFVRIHKLNFIHVPYPKTRLISEINPRLTSFVNSWWLLRLQSLTFSWHF